jgi:hypothetical protein
MRELLDGATYRVWSGLDHGKDKMEGFDERAHFLQILEEVQLQHPFELLTFTILTDKIYMVLRPLHVLDKQGKQTDKWEQLPVIMQKIKWRYAKWFNTRYDICGHVWRNRYASTILYTREEIEAAVMEIDMYAVKESAAKTPEEYVFSGVYFHIHEIVEVEDVRTRGSYLRKSWRHRRKERGSWGKEEVAVVEKLEHLKLLGKMKPFLGRGPPRLPSDRHGKPAVRK